MYHKKEKAKKSIIAFTAVLCAFLLFGSIVGATSPSQVIVASVNYVDQKFNELAQRISNLESTGLPSQPSQPTQPSTAPTSQEIAELQKSIDLIKAQLKNFYDPQIVALSEGNKFSVVVLEKGQSIIASDTVEMIVRSGVAHAIEGRNGDGLADLTVGDGKDYYTGDVLPLNHFLLLSRGDGRGVKAISETVYVMVKGQYGIRLSD